MRHPLRHSRRRGNNAVEFVLCLPIWIAVVMAIMDYGWLFFRQTSLDAAANIGCRAGSLVDPGNGDENIAMVELRATGRMRAEMGRLGSGTCDTCDLVAYTAGAPPERSLVCSVTEPLTPLVGVYVQARSLTSQQVARLEWQREAAP